MKNGTLRGNWKRGHQIGQDLAAAAQRKHEVQHRASLDVVPGGMEWGRSGWGEQVAAWDGRSSRMENEQGERAAVEGSCALGSLFIVVHLLPAEDEALLRRRDPLLSTPARKIWGGEVPRSRRGSGGLWRMTRPERRGRLPSLRHAP